MTDCTPSSKQALLPCPFCGQSAMEFFRDDSKMYGVGCMNCSATKLGATAEQALINWNTRVADEPSTSRLEERITTAICHLECDDPAQARKVLENALNPSGEADRRVGVGPGGGAGHQVRAGDTRPSELGAAQPPKAFELPPRWKAALQGHCGEEELWEVFREAIAHIQGSAPTKTVRIEPNPLRDWEVPDETTASPEGWVIPAGAARAHYIVNDWSLCSGWKFADGSKLNPDFEGGDDEECSECRTRLNQRRAPPSEDVSQ